MCPAPISFCKSESYRKAGLKRFCLWNTLTRPTIFADSSICKAPTISPVCISAFLCQCSTWNNRARLGGVNNLQGWNNRVCSGFFLRCVSTAGLALAVCRPVNVSTTCWCCHHQSLTAPLLVNSCVALLVYLCILSHQQIQFCPLRRLSTSAKTRVFH